MAEFNRLCRESVFTYRGDWERLSERIGYWLDYDDPYVTYTQRLRRERVVGAEDAVSRRSCCIAATRSCRTARAAARRCRATRWRRATRTSRIRACTSRWISVGGGEAATTRRHAGPHGAPHPRVDDDAVDARVERGARGASGARRTSSCAKTDERRTRGRSSSPRRARARCSATTTTTAGTQVGTLTRRGARGRALSPSARLARRIREGTNTRSSSARASCRADDGIGRRAHGAGVRRGRLRGGPAAQPRVPAAGERARRVPGGRCRSSAACSSRTPTPRSSRSSSGAACCGRRGRSTHSYPHCWRCGTPLLYYARTSWFVRTTAYKDEMLARNARVDWHPPEIGDGPIRRVAGEQHRLGDLARSLLGHAAAGLGLRRGRRRTSTCVGSYAELARAHRARRCRDGLRSAQAARRRVHVGVPRAGCDGTMRRAPRGHRHLVRLGLDAVRAVALSVRESRRSSRRSIPADFIAEGVDQTRGWFYSLLAIATGLGDALPNNCDRSGRTRDCAVSRGRRERPRARRRRAEDVEEPRQRRRSVGGVRAARRRTRCGSFSWRRARSGCRGASTRALIRAGRGRFLLHAQERLQRDLRAVRELRLVAVGRGSGAGGRGR